MNDRTQPMFDRHAVAAHRDTVDRPFVQRRARASRSRSSTRGVQMRNPVMFVVLVGSVLTTVLGIAALRRCDQVRPATAFILRSRRGCGSRCCSPTSPRRGGGARQGAGGGAARKARARQAQRLIGRSRAHVSIACRRRSLRRATSCSSKPAISFRATAKSSRASPRSTRARSRASPRRSFARRGRSPRSPAVRACCRTGSSCASPRPGRRLPRPHDRDGRGREA